MVDELMDTIRVLRRCGHTTSFRTPTALTPARITFFKLSGCQVCRDKPDYVFTDQEVRARKAIATEAKSQP